MKNNNLKITRQEFKSFMQLLNGFDYYYSYSDDAGIYRRGKQDDEEISSKCKKNPLLAEIYANWELVKTSKDGGVVLAAKAHLAAIEKQYITEDAPSATDELVKKMLAVEPESAKAAQRDKAVFVNAAKEPTAKLGSVVRHFGKPQTDDEYVASREKEAAQLFVQMKWVSAGSSGSTMKCEIYNIVLWRCFMHYNSTDVNISVKEAKAEPIAPYIAEFKTEAQMLAWILQRYW